MFTKKFVTFTCTFGLLLALIIPVMAQDASPTPAPGDSSAAVSTPEATPAPLVATTTLFVTSDFRVNVRSGPGREYTILGKMRPSDGLDITGQNADASWLRVNFNGQEGWVFADVVNVTGAIETAPVAEAGPTAVLREGQTQPGSTTASDNVVIVTRFNTNLRSDTSVDADILEVIPFNTELQVQGRTTNNNWLMVTFGDQSGWVFAPIVLFSSGEVTALPVMGDAEAAPQAQPTTNP